MYECMRAGANQSGGRWEGVLETRDGKKHNDLGETSVEMKVRNKDFARNHAMSIHLNLLAVGATLWYGLRLASKLETVV